VRNNGKQPRNSKLLGGITGRGFLPGHSGNPLGRPRSKGLSEALREKVLEIGPDGRSVAQLIADMLVTESLSGRHRIAAATLILDRLEGRAIQQVSLDVVADLDRRSDDELRFYLEHSRWPDEQELLALPNGDEGRKSQ
jgi:hypothetical protein